MLERNSSTGKFRDYITAVIDSVRNPFAVSRSETARKNLIIFDEDADRSNKTIYEIKHERMATEGRDRELAQVARRVMKRECKEVQQDILELPNTLGAMFISETSRLPPMLPLGIMMLDLIEARVAYGTVTPKLYTWKKLMTYAGDGGDQRLQYAQLYGGKHPMMHQNTVKEAKNFSNEYNMVTLRSISILVTWLHIYLRINPAQWETRVIRADRQALFTPGHARPIPGQALKQFATNIKNNNIKNNNMHALFYNEAIRPALMRRSGTLDILF
ncbi:MULTISPECIES: hypothetical protein [Corallococcus]|uniref:hypothetical protein n=1 Tax=Corallococcus TaxID=83461 RepID=UPI0011E605E3|nr:MULTISPECIES: hypothetical protein [Corallococcus]NRD51771.1 hypothetical protein [Corallococcus exiguus]